MEIPIKTMFEEKTYVVSCNRQRRNFYIFCLYLEDYGIFSNVTLEDPDYKVNLCAYNG
jgi:hypothetical protein